MSAKYAKPTKPLDNDGTGIPDGGTGEFPKSGNSYDANGNLLDPQAIAKYYPANEGFDANGYRLLSLNEGTQLLRYGSNNGYYFTEPGTPQGFLNMPNSAGVSPKTFTVVKPFYLKFGGVGGSIGNASQYVSPKSVDWLILNGYIK
jgi:hypothetical protein